jgi:hypothetical protein
MNDRLLPCPSCARHVRGSEEACPFCTAPLATSRRAPAPRSPGARLSRAALYAFGASAAALAACGGTTGNTFADGGPDASDESTPMPVYGGPVADGGQDGPFLADAAYGGPPQDGAADAEDGGSDAEGGIQPPYGAPP